MRQQTVAPAVKSPVVNPYMVLVLAVVAVSFGSLFSRLAEAPPLIIATYRMLFTVALLAPATLATCRRELASLGCMDVLTALASGVFLALHFYTWITSLGYTTVASSTVLVTTHPIFVVIGSYLFLKEKIALKALAAGIAAMAGVILIGAGDFRLGQDALLGDLLAVSGAVLVSGYMLIGRKLRQRLSILAYTFLVYGSSTVVLLLLTLATKTPMFPYPPVTWLLFLGLALVPTIGGHTLFNWVLGYLPAPVVSVSILGEPVGATVLAMLFLAEVPSLQQLIGGAVILLGLYGFLAASRRP
ncbi:membrane protein [Clostridiales bacterium PH28_bin88]|nr:membrane protein [Clostridiales bacterium PH28_bin88]